jgi:hypothetical protein
MVSGTDLPTDELPWHTRRITAAEVLTLSLGEPEPDVRDADSWAKGIRACPLSNFGRLAIADALRRG